MKKTFQNKPNFFNKEKCERCGRMFNLDEDLDYNGGYLVCKGCEAEMDDMDL